MFIDIHTHHKKALDKTTISLVDGQDFVGMHPWFLNIKTSENEFEEIQKMHRSREILMIGETGLDRFKTDVDFELQIKFFNLHLDLATHLNRPLVIHCVRAHSDLIKILKERNFKGRILIHDYSAGESELKQYKKFDIYFSFGHSLFREGSKAQMLVKKIPLDRLFFETDDSKYTITQIYQQAQVLLLNNQLEEIMEKNFLRFFNQADDVGAANFIKNFHNRV